jgi:hypothetical protein
MEKSVKIQNFRSAYSTCMGIISSVFGILAIIAILAIMHQWKTNLSGNHLAILSGISLFFSITFLLFMIIEEQKNEISHYKKKCNEIRGIYTETINSF